MLEDMQSRVLRLAKTLHDSSQEKAFASTKLRLEDEVRQQRLGDEQCPTCGRMLVSTIARQHLSYCTGKSHGASLPSIPTSSNQEPHSPPVPRSSTTCVGSNASPLVLPAIQSAPVLPQFVSQPPRNLRVVEEGISHRSIMLAWDPPIFTGSNPIIDYEFAYFVNSACTEQQACSLVTSRWCLVVPVAPNQYLVDNLDADQEYAAFTLIAITVNGKSLPSNRIDLIKTTPSIEPTAPLFLSVGAVTAASVTLSWMEPMDSGGKRVVDYEIMFAEAIMQDQGATRFEVGFLNVTEVTYRPRRIRTYSTSTTFTITGLLSGKEHKQFRVRAVNNDGKPGDYSEAIESIFTIGMNSILLSLEWS